MGMSKLLYGHTLEQRMSASESCLLEQLFIVYTISSPAESSRKTDFQSTVGCLRPHGWVSCSKLAAST